MPRKLIGLVIAILTAGAAAAASPAAAQGLSGTPKLRAHQVRSVPPAMFGPLAEAKGFEIGARPLHRDKACELMSMTCDSTVTGVLDTTDCLLDDDTRIDFWEFQGNTGETVTINMTSSQFDTWLFLIDPFDAVASQDDDGGTGTNSRILFTLDASGLWVIGANGFGPADLGNYTLSLECTSGGQEPPAAPSNLSATTLSTTEVELTWQDNSNDEDEFRVEVRELGGSFQDIGSVPADSTGADVIDLLPATTYDFRVRAANAAGNSAYSNVATATTLSDDMGCTPTATNLCLLDSRFRVEVTWRDFDDNTGVGRVVPVTSPDSGLLWFFDADNWEMLVKMVDACSAPFNSFWVFAAATTNVEYHMRVTDTQSGAFRDYVNPLGTAAPAITDTSAFATCP